MAEKGIAHYCHLFHNIQLISSKGTIQICMELGNINSLNTLIKSIITSDINITDNAPEPSKLIDYILRFTNFKKNKPLNFTN